MGGTTPPPTVNLLPAAAGSAGPPFPPHTPPPRALTAGRARAPDPARTQMLKQEEAEEQGPTRQRTAEGEGSAPAEAAGEPAEAAAEMGLKTGTWKMPYDEGGPVATELSRMVNNKRTPSGNFLLLRTTARSAVIELMSSRRCTRLRTSSDTRLDCTVVKVRFHVNASVDRTTSKTVDGLRKVGFEFTVAPPLRPSAA